MVDTRIFAGETLQTPLVAPEQGSPELRVEQQKLSPRLMAYIKLLSDQQPLVQIDAKVARHRVVQELGPRWPKHAGWEKENLYVLMAIDEAVKTMAASGPTSDILLRITFGSRPLSPATLLEPKEAVAIVVFDSVNGVMRRCTVQEQVKPALNDMEVKAGLMIVCQPVPRIANQFGDNRMDALGNVANMYGSRERDLPFEKTIPEARFIPQSPAWKPDPNLTSAARLEHDAQGLDPDADTVEKAEAVLGADVANQEAESVVGGSAQQLDNTAGAGETALEPAAEKVAEPEAAPLTERHADESPDQRGEERPESRALDTTTVGGEPEAADESEIHEGAVLGREVAAAENEITSGPTAAAAEEFPLAPQRPEEAEAPQTVENPTEPAEVSETSPFAPPAAAIAAAAETTQGIEAAAAESTAAESSATEPSAAEPSAAEPSTAEPSTAELSEVAEPPEASELSEVSEPEAGPAADFEQDNTGLEEPGLEAAREEMRLPAVEMREGEFSPEATQARSAEHARERQNEINENEFEREEESNREDANGFVGPEPREGEASDRSSASETAEPGTRGFEGLKEKGEEQRHESESRHEESHSQDENHSLEEKIEEKEREPEVSREDVSYRHSEHTTEGRDQDVRRESEPHTESRHERYDEMRPESRDETRHETNREEPRRQEAAYERAERTDRETPREDGQRGAREDVNRHEERGHQRSEETRRADVFRRDMSERERRLHEELGDRKHAAPESIRQKDGFQEAVYRHPESKFEHKSELQAHYVDKMVDHFIGKPGLGGAPQHAVERNGIGDWGIIRAAVSRLPDKHLAALAAIHFPGARQVHHQRVAQRQAKEATAEDRDQVKQAMHDEKQREREVAAQAQQTKKDDATVQSHGPKPDDLTPD